MFHLTIFFKEILCLGNINIDSNIFKVVIINNLAFLNNHFIITLSPSGKWWGPTGIQPIVALHGRQDNAGSFDTLIPLLSDDISILCLDMPGHGLSSHYPKSQYYYVYWDGVILLRRIVKYFSWNKVSEWIKFYHSLYNLNALRFVIR